MNRGSWAKCTHCHAIRPTSKYRPDGRLHCAHCGRTRTHAWESPTRWAAETQWLHRLLVTAGVDLRVGEIAHNHRGRPVSVVVTCSDFDNPDQHDGPLAEIRVSLNQDLTAWGLPRALRAAWECLGQLDKWQPDQWTFGSGLSWQLTTSPGDVDAGHRHEWLAPVPLSSGRQVEAEAVTR